MPEYDFFIKPVVSLGLGLFSWSLNILSDDPGSSTNSTSDLEARGSAKLRFVLGSFWLDVGYRVRMINSLGSEIWLMEPLARLGIRF
jgi:hypothetical protein